MKIGVSQLNLKIGSLEDNADKIIAAACFLSEQGGELAIFPELAISGYYPWDLLEQPGFVEAQIEQLHRIAKQTSHLGLDIILGVVTINHGAGKPFRNSFVHIKQGRIVHTGHKQLLPTYNIFDERRHFEPGDTTSIIHIGHRSIAILICEDAWNDGTADYSNNPVQAAKQGGAEAIITINASPWQTGKHLARVDLFSQMSSKHAIPILYVNQVGAHDEIIYDGASFAVAPEQGATWRGLFAQEQNAILDFNGDSFCGPAASEWPLTPPDQHLSMIELGLRDYMRKCGFTSVVVGSSGGIDSAVTIALAERVLGSANVAAITMPSKYSSSGSVSDSVELCDNLGIRLHTLSIQQSFNAQLASYSETFGHTPVRIAIENSQARLRGLALMTFSNDTGALLLTTGNKSEVSVGYCTLYGDMNGGLNLIGDLYKTEVYALARHINAVDSRRPIPSQIIDKAPSAELFDDQKDSDSLPPYEELDAILRLYIERDLLSPIELSNIWATLASFSTSNQLMEKIMGMVDKAEFKRWQSCPILRVHARAFGTGRRYPIAQGFHPTASMLKLIKSKPMMAKN